MKYCYIDGKKINQPQGLPSSFKNVVGGLHLLGEKELNNLGWFRYSGHRISQEEIVTDYELVGNVVRPMLSHINTDHRLDNENKGNELLSSSDWVMIPDALEMGRVSKKAYDEVKSVRKEIYELKNTDTKQDWKMIECKLNHMFKL